MTCARFAEARVLEVYGEIAGPDWERHFASCDSCVAEVDELRAVRRLYAEDRPHRLAGRSRRAIVSTIRRERNRGRVRSALATVTAIAAAVLLLAGVGRAPGVVHAAETGPAGSVIDEGLVEIRDRLAGLEAGEQPYFDATLDELKSRVGLLTWDAENM